MELKFEIIHGRLHLDYLLRSALLLFNFEFIPFSCRLLFIVVTVLIESCDFGQVLPVPTNLPFLSPKTLVKPNKHNLHWFTKFYSKWNFQT